MTKVRTALLVAAVACGASADVVLDNIGDGSLLGTGIPHASQDFESEFDSFDVAVIDDFSVSATQLRIATVEGVFGFWGENIGWSGPITGYRIEVYSSPMAAGTTLVGDVASYLAVDGSVTMPFGGGGAAEHRGLLALETDIALPVAGTYWLGIIPVMSYDENGQIGVIDSPMGDQNAKQANPEHGLGFNLRDLDGPAGDSAAYRITATPEPAAGLGLALLATLAVTWSMGQRSTRWACKSARAAMVGNSSLR